MFQVCFFRENFIFEVSFLFRYINEHQLGQAKLKCENDLLLQGLRAKLPLPENDKENTHLANLTNFLSKQTGFFALGLSGIRQPKYTNWIAAKSGQFKWLYSQPGMFHTFPVFKC